MSTKDQRTINMVHYPLGDSANPQELGEYLDSIDATAAAKIGGTLGATDNRLPRSDGTGGKTLQATGITVDDSNNMSGVVTLTADTLSPTNALAINKGGTANTTATAAFDALAPTTTRGDLIRRGASANERVALGASGTVLQSDGTDAVWGSGAVPIVAAGAVAAAATLDIAVSSAYDMYEFDIINFVPATDNQALLFRVSQSGSFLSGGSDYFWGYQSAGGATPDETDAQIVVSGGTVGNQSNEGVTLKLWLFRPGVASFQKTVVWTAFGRTGTPTSFGANGGGALAANTDAIDAVRFQFTGNIATGYYAVRGYKFS